MGGTSCPGDDHFDTALGGRFGIFSHFVGRAMGAHHIRFEINSEFAQDVPGTGHRLPIRLAAHDDPDYWLTHAQENTRSNSIQIDEASIFLRLLGLLRRPNYILASFEVRISNQQGSKSVQANIKVIGIGGAGGNAVNRMVKEGVEGVEFVSMNTDAQVLGPSLAETKIRLGEAATRGLGAGGDPEVGDKAAKESERQIAELLDGTDMVFITAGMGGGTGTGAAPVVAELAKRLGILTVAVVSKPFTFEGPKRRKIAEQGALRLAEHVDTLIVVPNDRLMEVVDRRASVQDAFIHADDVLRQGVQGISDIITKPGLINLDFADVRSVMKDAGAATMGMGRASGEGRARIAAELAASSPMLENSLHGAKKLLVNITSGSDFNIGEAYEAMEYLQQFVDPEDAEIFLGHVLRADDISDVSITVLGAGMSRARPRAQDQAIFPSVAREIQEITPSEIAEEAGLVGATREATSRPIGLDEIDIDIPSFLRRQRMGQ